MPDEDDTATPALAVPVNGGVGLSIRKQPSNGRGEYELVGRTGDTGSSDFLDRDLMLETRYGEKPTNVFVSDQGGKNRLRLRVKHGGLPHIQRQMATMAMLPECTRDESRVSAALPVLLQKRYLIDIDVDLVSLSATKAVLRPTALLARSGDLSDSGAMLRIPLNDRLDDVGELYAVADRLPASLAHLVRKHQRLVFEPEGLGPGTQHVVKEIMEELDSRDDFYLPGSDPLPALRLLARLTSREPVIPEPPETPADELAVRLRSEHIFRLRRMRGPAATAFRMAVQKAYDFRCAFCGLRAPRVGGLVQSGVDAAHILPWGAYDLDVTPNGLMLCKQHHWSFDNRVLRVDHAGGNYFVSMSERAHQYVQDDEKTLAILMSATGKIPTDRLPSAKSQRPSTTFIDEYNALAV